MRFVTFIVLYRTHTYTNLAAKKKCLDTEQVSKPVMETIISKNKSL